jgi:hypothetical protein
MKSMAMLKKTTVRAMEVTVVVIVVLVVLVVAAVVEEGIVTEAEKSQIQYQNVARLQHCFPHLFEQTAIAAM